MLMEVFVVRVCFASLAILAGAMFEHGYMKKGESVYYVLAGLMIAAILIGLVSFNKIIQMIQ